MSLIRVDPLAADGKEIIPAFSLDREISRYNFSPVEVYKTAPILAQHAHAFFGRNPDGSHVSPEYRKSVYDQRYRGEWTATWLRDGKEVVERPDNVVFENGLWVAIGGVIKNFDHFPEGRLPADGWGLEYDIKYERPTGFPLRTGSYEEAREIFSRDASYFSANRTDLRPVRRDFGRFGDYGPFGVLAVWQPDGRPDDVGSRSVVKVE